MYISARWIPRLINGIAITHVVAGLAFWTPVRDIVDAGVINSVAGFPEREASLWFLATGFAWLTTGELARWTLRETDRLPTLLGAWLLGISVPMIVLEPVSHTWLVAGIGVLALSAAHDENPHAVVTQVPQGAATHA